MRNFSEFSDKFILAPCLENFEDRRAPKLTFEIEFTPKPLFYPFNLPMAAPELTKYPTPSTEEAVQLQKIFNTGYYFW